MSGPALVKPKADWPKMLPFRIRKENWSRYEFFDGKIQVAARAILMGVEAVDPRHLPPGIQYREGLIGTVCTNVQMVFADDEYRGKPTEKELPFEMLREHGRPVRFDRMEEPDNEYLLIGDPDRIFTTRLTVQSILYPQGFFDTKGQPYVVVDFALQNSLARELTLEEVGR